MIAKANLDGCVVRGLLGGMYCDESPTPWHCGRERLDNSGLEMGCGNLDAGVKSSENIVCRPGLNVNRSIGTANHLLTNRQDDHGTIEFHVDAEQVKKLTHTVAVRVLVVVVPRE